MERSKTVKGIQWATLVVLLLLWVYPASVYIGWNRESKAIKSLEAFKGVHTKTGVAEPYEVILEKVPFFAEDVFQRCVGLSLHGEVPPALIVDTLDTFSHLESLHLHNVQLTDAILEAVVRCETLESLRISGEVAVKGEVLELLGGLSKLSHLSIENAGDIDDDDLRWFAGHEDLTSLSLGGSRVRGEGLRYLAASPGLSSLSLDDSPFNDDGLRALTNFPSLWGLSLRNTPISGVGVTNLSGKMFLYWCNFSGASVSNEFLDVISTWPALYALDLSGSQVGGGGFGGFTNAHQLYSLDLSGTKVTDGDLEALGKIPRLGSLNLRGTGLTGRGLRKIDGSPSLDLRETAVTEAELKVVVEDYLPREIDIRVLE